MDKKTALKIIALIKKYLPDMTDLYESYKVYLLNQKAKCIKPEFIMSEAEFDFLKKHLF